MSNLYLERIVFSQLDLLQDVSLQTFHDGFFHLNDPRVFFEYTDQAFSKAKLSEELITDGTEFYFLKANDEILGYFKINESNAQSDLRDPESLEIERIYILKEKQNLGLGKFLLDKIKEIAVQKKLRYIWLGVWEKNLAAIRFYERNGFYVSGSHEFLMGSEIQIDLIMKWEIE